jgi:hypothetical protein
MNDQIGIKIDAKKLTPEKFMEAVGAFISVVQGVGKNLSASPISWTVEVAKGSAVFRMLAENPSRDSSNAVRAIKGGLRSLRSGVRSIPYGFMEPEMRALRTLASLTEDASVQSVSIKNGGKWEDWPKSVIPTVDAMLIKESHIAYGSIEGEVVAFSRRQGFICTIYDPIYQREILCYLQKDDAKASAIEAFKTEARVLADGLVRYTKEGHPANISADAIRVFPPESDLPTLEEVQAIYRLT